MDAQATTLPLPVYTFVLKDKSGAVFLRAGKDLFLPLFTSKENASLYQQRTSMDCIIVTIETPEGLRVYIANPPSRGNATVAEFLIVVDPIDADTGDYNVMERAQFLDSLRNDP